MARPPINPLLKAAMAAEDSPAPPEVVELPKIKVSPDKTWIAIENSADMAGGDHNWFIYSKLEGGRYATDEDVADWDNYEMSIATGT